MRKRELRSWRLRWVGCSHGHRFSWRRTPPGDGPVHLTDCEPVSLRASQRAGRVHSALSAGQTGAFGYFGGRAWLSGEGS
ncbi:FtsK/SpoIIIE family protein [Methylobacterium sp. ME121]|nr:FtsK/SpoIIIE family protein [Methylobacterium sp. ME121]